MATVAIGDVHGNRPALDDLLARLEPELRSEDTVVFLGDYIDRGPDSRGCIDRILDLARDSSASIVTLVGNHEDWLMASLRDHHRHDWLLGMEGFDTIASYSRELAAELRRQAEAAGTGLYDGRVSLPYDRFLDILPAAHVAFLRDLRVFHRSPHAICVHGGYDPRVGTIESQPRENLIWGSARFLRSYDGPDVVVYGHWNNAVLDANGWPQPAFGPASIGLDTISHGVLSAVRLPDRRVFQSDRFEC